jgi:hypothetical protein
LKIELLLNWRKYIGFNAGEKIGYAMEIETLTIFTIFSSARQNKSMIKYIVDDVDHKWDDPEGMTNLIKFYFDKLLM